MVSPDIKAEGIIIRINESYSNANKIISTNGLDFETASILITGLFTLVILRKKGIKLRDELLRSSSLTNMFCFFKI